LTRKKRTKPQGQGAYYAQLWRIVDGAVADAFHNHPDYLAAHEKNVRASVNKRVVGAILSFVEQSARGRPVQAAVEPKSSFSDMAAWRGATRQVWGGLHWPSPQSPEANA
jgi:hypothetical protein